MSGTAEGVDGARDRRLDGRARRHVRFDGDRRIPIDSATRARLIAAQIDHRYARSLGREAPGHALAEAAARAGDESDFPSAVVPRDLLTRD